MNTRIYIIFSIFLSMWAVGQDWRQVTTASDGSKYSIKKTTTNSTGNSQVWVRKEARIIKYFDSSSNEKQVWGGQEISLHEYNCTLNKYRFLQMVIYDASAKIVKATDYPSKWAFVIPDTSGEKIMEAVCN